MHFRGASDGAEFGKTRILATLSNERQPLGDICAKLSRKTKAAKACGLGDSDRTHLNKTNKKNAEPHE
jgi:hypothetical protein